MSSWGNVIHAPHLLLQPQSRSGPFPDISPSPNVLPRGNGRSYGDSCLNVGAALLHTGCLNRFMAFDPATGVLICESGMLLADILKLTVPQGWFVAVTPGTRFVTIGGAIANDVHGKNHHRAGTFARHVRRFELLRSDGERMICSSELNAEWFAATVGGLGLTGLITWAELQLRRIPGPWLDVESIRFKNLEEFIALAESSDRDFEYTVAWVDCLGRGKQLGRGLFERANHTQQTGIDRKHGSLRIPVVPPISLVNAASLRLFNSLYYYRQRRAQRRRVVHYEAFFYPLDGILHWNRIYGPRGLYQYQCVIPTHESRGAISALLETIARSGQGSFLAVLKHFGDSESVGMLSFPRAGITLALDFPNRGDKLERLFRQMDEIVQRADGRIYPAKDGRMPGALFRGSFPKWAHFSRYIDPRFSSSFWRRVMEEA